MKFEINEKEVKELKGILLKIAELNKISYGFDLRADIKNGEKEKNVELKISGLRI